MKILYILSSPRGGSTLLSYVLGRNSNMTNLGEVSFLPKLMALSEPCSCGDDLNSCPQWGKAFSYLKAKGCTDMRDDPYGFNMGEVIKRGGGKIDTERQTAYRKLNIKSRSALDRVSLDGPVRSNKDATMLPWTRQAVDNTYLLFQAISQTWNTDVIIDASKLNRKGLDLYRRYPNNVRLLHLSRDGRGVSASRKSIMPVKQGAMQWQRYHADTLKWLSKWVQNDHKMAMSYEQFVDSPEETLSVLCNWLDVKFEPGMIDFTKDIETHFAGGNLPARSKMGSGIRKADEKWKTNLDQHELDDFEQVAGSMNTALGYK